MEDMTAADRIPGDKRDDHLGHGADQFLQVEHVQPGNPVLPHVARMAADTLVASGAKGVLAVGVGARPRQEHDADRRVLPSVDKGVDQFRHRLGPEGVSLFRAVDRHLGDPVSLVVENVSVGLRSGPRRHARHPRQRRALVQRSPRSNKGGIDLLALPSLVGISYHYLFISRKIIFNLSPKNDIKFSPLVRKWLRQPRGSAAPLKNSRVPR